MMTSNSATYPQSNTGATYGETLGRAFRTFLAALLAVQPAKRSVAKEEEVVSARTATVDMRKLYRLAGNYDSVSPKLAAELANAKQD